MTAKESFSSSAPVDSGALPAWVSVPGRLPVRVRLLPDGEVAIWSRIKRPGDVDALFDQVKTLLENRTEVALRKQQHPPESIVSERQYRLFECDIHPVTTESRPGPKEPPSPKGMGSSRVDPSGNHRAGTPMVPDSGRKAG